MAQRKPQSHPLQSWLVQVGQSVTHIPPVLLDDATAVVAATVDEAVDDAAFIMPPALAVDEASPPAPPAVATEEDALVSDELVPPVPLPSSP